MILLSLSFCLSASHICSYTHTLIHHLHTKTYSAHTPGAVLSLFPESIYSGCRTTINHNQNQRCQSNFLKTIIIITTIVSSSRFYHHHLVAENNTAKFKARDENGGMGREKERVQPTCVRWQPLQRRRTAPAICSTVCEGCMKGRNGRRVSPCQSYLGEKCWKNTIFHTAISGGEGKMGRIRKKMRNWGAALKKEG